MRVLFLQKHLPQEMPGVAWSCGASKRATQTASLATSLPVDFVHRVSSKSVLELRESHLRRRFSNRRLRLEMEDDTIARAGG